VLCVDVENPHKSSQLALCANFKSHHFQWSIYCT